MSIDIKKYIPSTYMNNYLDELHHEFSDFEKATIIYNSHYPKKEILSDLKSLMEQTADERLKAQIEEHLKYEQKKYETFIIAGDKIMYDLRVCDDDSPYARAYVHDSFYKTMSAAEQAAKNSGEKCEIVKCYLYSDGETCEDSQYENELASIEYDDQGKLMNIWSSEVSDKVIEDGKDRFEEAYVSFPLPFKRGDIVRHIETGRVGVVALPKNEQERKEWEKHFTQNGHIDLDWTSVMINVEFLYNDAAFDHDHVFPFDLELANLSDDDRRKEVLLYASQLMQGNGSIQCFQMACEEYCKQKNSYHDGKNGV